MKKPTTLQPPQAGMTPEVNGELLHRAREGDPRAFEDLVKHYDSMVFNFSFKVCRDRTDAEETMQDTFVNVYRKLKQYKQDAKFSTWLYSIVANCCLMKRRRKKLEKSSVSLDSPADTETLPIADNAAGITWGKTPFEEAMSKELRTVLDETIQKLPVDYRLVFILRDIEGKSAAETAAIMKLSIPAVKSRLRRARMFLRDHLKDYVTS
jgi:RNA polymerase sigma-70 factor (ECF subfamily)